MWKLRWNSNFPHKNVNRFETIFVLCGYDGGGPVLYLAGWAELGSVFWGGFMGPVRIWTRPSFFLFFGWNSWNIFCFGGAKVFIRQMKRLVKEMIARGEWADKTSRRFRRLNLSLFSIFWKLITSFVICREFF